MSLILRAGDHGTSLGGKARSLAELASADLPIPPWFVLAPEAFFESLEPEAHRRLLAATSPQEVWEVVAEVSPSSGVERQLAAALAELCPAGERVAVRSSADDEDGTEHSFAGQLDSFLFVAPEDASRRVADVWRSGFGERVLAYRRENGLRLVPSPPAVLVQKMVDAEVSGVAFGADPVSGRRGLAVVGSVYGLGTALVSGECDSDVFEVDRRRRIVRRELAYKAKAHRFDAATEEGVSSVPVNEELASLPSLTEDQILAVADLVRRTGRHFARPQDIEWAIAGERLFLLQSRPITSLTRLADPDAALNLWDNSNITESYSGVTTPLTFSFARRIYEEAYRQFLHILQVPRAKIAAHEGVLRRMLGLIQGRVYYNLLSWYRILALLPGFQANRRFMEQMMGVQEELPEELVVELEAARWRDRMLDRLHLLRTGGGLIWHHLTLPRQTTRFYRRLHQALGTESPELESYRADELVAYFGELEGQLLKRWDAPLVNDFFAMIFYGVLTRLVERWVGEPGLQNDLLCGEGGMISAEPAKRVLEMAALAAPHADLTDALCERPEREILAAMACVPELSRAYEAYLASFGDRCLEELKLESSTLHDDPTTLLRSIGLLARRRREAGETPAAPPPESELRSRAEARVQASLRGRLLRRALFRWVAKQARARVRNRENLRFERTRLFGRVRRIFVELGRRLHEVGCLASPRDVFYLEQGEIFGFVDGTASTTDLRGLVELRRAEYRRHQEADPPADRFETRGIVHQGNRFRSRQGPTVDLEADACQGLAACPGHVTGPVRVIRDPRQAVLKPGEILVAERTDPGWILLFPAASGLLVERGSLLSHSAIVAREMGIPAIVALPGLTEWLKDGDWVELDGGSGRVRRIPPPVDEAGA